MSKRLRLSDSDSTHFASSASGDVMPWTDGVGSAHRTAAHGRPTLAAWLIPLTDDPSVHAAWIDGARTSREALTLLAESRFPYDHGKLKATAERLSCAAADLRQAAQAIESHGA